jgi:hypothetical protein
MFSSHMNNWIGLNEQNKVLCYLYLMLQKCMTRFLRVFVLSDKSFWDGEGIHTWFASCWNSKNHDC